MVHQRDELDGKRGEERGQTIDEVRGRDLATQMRQMVGAQQARFGRPAHRLGDRSDFIAELGARFVFIDPDAKRVRTPW